MRSTIACTLSTLVVATFACGGDLGATDGGDVGVPDGGDCGDADGCEPVPCHPGDCTEPPAECQVGGRCDDSSDPPVCIWDDAPDGQACTMGGSGEPGVCSAGACVSPAECVVGEAGACREGFDCVDGQCIPGGPNFTAGDETAHLHGTHEVVLAGDGAVDNPFLTRAQVTFTPPSGSTNEVTVEAFYDGEDTWRARCYVTEVGQWGWRSLSDDDDGLDGGAGEFEAAPSTLRGMLRPHADNGRAWATDDGQTFLNFNDTAYRLFNSVDPDVGARWQDYVLDDIAQGITSVRSGALGGFYWGDGAEDNGVDVSDYGWQGTDYSRFDLSKYQETDRRLRWLLDTAPDLYVQHILFGLVGWAEDSNDDVWDALTDAEQRQTVRYMMARWAAFPQLYWLIVNDMHASSSYPGNARFAREVGPLIDELDPYDHLLSVGLNRGQDFLFADEPWVSYIHIEVQFDLDAYHAETYDEYANLHVFMGEDRYEHCWGTDRRDPHHMDYFQRRIFISWLLAGGSANYGGRYSCIDPYSQTGSLSCDILGRTYDTPLVGLDSLPNIHRFIDDHGIDVAEFAPADSLASLVARTEHNGTPARAKCMHRGFEDYVLYLPNPRPGEAYDPANSVQDTEPDPDHAPTVALDLRDRPGTYDVHWFAVATGESLAGDPVEGGDSADLSSPWPGVDVLLMVSLQ